ncbi:MAG: hypothetical protein QOI56_1299, partial [Actinomycetota bacterium]|nr:hypothetical protein [Actinomycetota bacterium]
MPELNIGIDASVLSSLTELPGQVLAAIGPAQQAIDQARQGGGPGAAIEGLFGTLGSLAGDLGQLPDMSELIGGLSGLGDLLPTGAIGDSGALQDALGGFSGLFGPVFDLLSGDPQAALSAAVTRAGDLVSSVKGGGGELGAIGDEFTHFLQLLGSLDDWGTAPPSPATVAGLLAQALVGVRLDVLAAPTAALAATMAHLADLVPPGVDLDRWRVGVDAQLGRWTAIEARLAGPTVDWVALEADIQVAGHELVELVAARDRLISAAVGAMTRIDLSSLHAVADALRAIPEIPDLRLTPVLDGLLDQMGGIRDFLHTWHPDAADGRRLVRGLMQKLLELLEHSPLGQARNAILSFEQRILATIESMPLRALAEELTAIVRQVAGHELVELVAARDRLISAAVGAMTRIDLSSLHAVADALRAIPEIPDIRLTPVLDGLRDQMGGIRDFLRTWHPDAADGRQLVRGLMQKLLELLEHSPLGQARNAILSFEQRILATIE